MPAVSSRSMFIRCAAVPVAVIVLGAATASAAGITLIGSRSKSGPFAVALLTKEAKAPSAMYYKVTTVPAAEEIGVLHTMSCLRGSQTKTKRSPVKNTTSSARVKVPVTLTNATCSLTVNAQLENRSGQKVTVKIYKR